MTLAAVPIKLLRNLIFMENVLGIFRKDLLGLPRLKYFYTLFFVLFFGIEKIYVYLTTGYFVWYLNLLPYLKTIFFLAMGYYNAERFERLLFCLNLTHNKLKNNEKYLRQLKRLRTIIVGVSWFMLIILVPANPFTWSSYLCDELTPAVIFTHLGLSLALLRCLLEETMSSCLAIIISLHFEYIRESVVNDCKECLPDVDGKTEDYQNMEDLTNWSDVYMNISKCIKLTNSVFGFQLTVIIGTYLFYQVYFFCSIVLRLLQKNNELIEIVQLVYTCSPELVALSFLAYSGQRLQNNKVHLQRTLARIAHLIVDESVNYKSVRNLVKLVRSHQLRVEAYGRITIGTTLFPSLAFFFTSYVIIALQFNSVI